MNDKNLQLDSIKLAEKQDFISWVKYGTNGDKWKKWLSSNPDQVSKINEAKNIVNSLKFTSSQLKINKTALWDKIEASTEGSVVEIERSTTKVRRLYRLSFTAIAASLVILLGVTFLLQQNINVITPPGQNITHTLPDNSMISINAGSQITYDKKAWEKNRKVKLNGEAFFEVEKGSTFTVETDNGHVQVLGTKFNVFSRNGSFTVKCTEGKVQVSNKNNSVKEVLQAGDVVQLDENNALVKIPFQAKFDWRQKAYSYNTVPLEEVFKEIERQFDVDINASSDILAMSYTGSLETKDLKKALYMVTWPMSLNYNINGNKIEIEKKK
jgi:ferric-dicitrate binding protein FerR (iron transport regulator)